MTRGPNSALGDVQKRQIAKCTAGDQPTKKMRSETVRHKMHSRRETRAKMRLHNLPYAADASCGDQILH